MSIYLLVIIILIHSEYLKCDINVQDDSYSNAEVITNQERFDGFGAQFQNIINTAVYAELNNKKYVYTPFKTMEHNYNSDIDFITKKEWLINFIGNFEINKNNAAKPQPECHDFFDEHIIKCANSQTLLKIKKVFKENKNILNYFNKEYLNIALHIKRPNSHDSRTYGTDIPYLGIKFLILKLIKLFQ